MLETAPSISFYVCNLLFSQLLGVGTPALRKIIFLVILFSLARFSNAFIVLRAADVVVAAAMVPMVMVLMNIAFSLSSYPFGLISDHIKPSMLLMVGLILLIFSDLVFASADTPYGILLGVILFGLHLGATQGIFATLVASVADSDRRTTAFGLFNFFFRHRFIGGGSLCRFLMGILWSLLFISRRCAFCFCCSYCLPMARDASLDSTR